MTGMYRYFLSATIAGETIEREVSVEEYCKAERAAGFRPKLCSDDPAYMTTPATGGFGGDGIKGRTEYLFNKGADMQTTAQTRDHTIGFDDFLTSIRQRFVEQCASGALFRTNADGLWDAYLGAIPDEDKQYHTCSCCRHFINRYGDLVTINDEGEVVSAIWDLDDTPEYYKPAVDAMLNLIRRAKVNRVFLTSEPSLGIAVTGPWTHYSVAMPAAMLHKRRGALTAGQAAAAKKEDFKNVLRAVLEFDSTVVQQAVTLLKTDSLYRAEKVLGPAEWLLNLHHDIDRTKRKAMMVWRAVATAPAGFCHPRSSMIGTLLDDLVAGTPLDVAAKNFKAKMHPLLYQRPQAAPKAGAIDAAEKLVAEMGIASALNRRFLRPDEVEYIWQPTAAAPAEGVFGHLKQDSKQEKLMPGGKITLSKFLSEILPVATAIRCILTPSGNQIVTLTTAADPDAKPILQWDSEENRNPVAWYLWSGGSLPGQFQLKAGSVDVIGVCKPPHAWRGNDGKFPHQGGHPLFLLRGASESRVAGSALFPECLKSELHGIRSVIEAHSRRVNLPLFDGPTASGLSAIGAAVRVEMNGIWMRYTIDRKD